jgi:hypothetical protein
MPQMKPTERFSVDVKGEKDGVAQMSMTFHVREADLKMPNALKSIAQQLGDAVEAKWPELKMINPHRQEVVISIEGTNLLVNVVNELMQGQPVLSVSVGEDEEAPYRPSGNPAREASINKALINKDKLLDALATYLHARPMV